MMRTSHLHLQENPNRADANTLILLIRSGTLGFFKQA
jgi:hypothetical protein